MGTNYPEVVQLNNKRWLHMAQQFENSWLARCLFPVWCIYDQGSKFIRHNFLSMLDEYNNIHQPTTVKSLCAPIDYTSLTFTNQAMDFFFLHTKLTRLIFRLQVHALFISFILMEQVQSITIHLCENDLTFAVFRPTTYSGFTTTASFCQ
jgi:hypothetical protein